MAFARLIFPVGTTVQQKLKDIAKICTGATTTTANLEFASQTNSTVVSTESAGWTLADAASAFEANGTATNTSYRLSSPCVNTSKTKYCELSAWVNQGYAANGIIANTRPAAAATTGYMYIPIGTGVSANALVNPIWYLGTVYNNNGSGVFTAYAVDLSNTTSTLEYFVSVSARKLVVVAAGSTAIMNLEFPETAHTTQWNNLPLININIGSPQTVNNIATPTVAAYPANYVFLGGAIAGFYFYQSSWFTNWYSVVDGLRSVYRSADDCLKSYYMPTPPSRGTNASGNSVFPLNPFIDIRHTRGEGTHNYSALTDVYYTTRIGTYTGRGEEIVAPNGDTYVLTSAFNTIGTPTPRVLALKKA